MRLADNQLMIIIQLYVDYKTDQLFDRTVITSSRCQTTNKTHSHFLCKQEVKRQDNRTEHFLVAETEKVDTVAPHAESLWFLYEI